MGDNGATEDNLTPDLRRCAADPVAKTLLQLSGKLSDKINDDHQGFPVGNGDSRGGDGVGEFDNCLRGGHNDDHGHGNGNDGSGDDGDDVGGDMDCCGDEEENDGDGEEEEDVVRFCCSADVADDDDQDQVVYDDGDNDGGDDDDVVDNNDVDDNDVDRVFLLDATRVDQSATVPSPVPASSFLFQPIDVATGISTSHGEDNI